MGVTRNIGRLLFLLSKYKESGGLEMKGTELKKVASVAIAGALVLSFTSCSYFRSAKDEIVLAAEGFASALVKQDTNKIVKLSTEEKDSEAVEALEVLFDDSFYSDDQNKFIKAVRNTIKYEVDEHSVEIDNEEASVDVIFTMVDYEKAFGDDFEGIDAVLDALNDCKDTKEVTITFEFEKADNKWLLSNLDNKGFSKLFDYYRYANIKIGLLSKMRTSEIYHGTIYFVTVYLYFSEDVSGYGTFTIDVYYEGQQIASDMNVKVINGCNVYCEYGEAGHTLDSGEYSVTVKCEGIEIVTHNATVDNSFSGNLADEIYSTDWWLDNDDNTYNSGVEKIEFIVYFTDKVIDYEIYNYDLTFNVYDGNGKAIAMNLEPEKFAVSVECVYEPGHVLPAGSYNIQLFNNSGSEPVLVASGYCEIK